MTKGLGIEKGLGVKGLGIPVGISGGAGGLSTPAKKAAPRWGWALLSNLEDFAHGIGPAVKALVASGYNDLDKITGNVLPGNAKTFKLDNIGDAVYTDLETRYGPLFKGEWGKFRDQLATRPLDFIFDAGMLATAGASATVTVPAKAITGSAKGVKGATLGAREATILDRAGFVERTPENLAAAERVYGKLSKQVREGAELGRVRGIRTTGGKDGGMALERMQRMNPLLRKRDELVDAAAGSAVLSKAPVVGVDARVARQDARRKRIQHDVRRQRMLAEPKRAVSQLRPDEQAAWFFLHTERARGAFSPDDYATMLRDGISKGDIDGRDRLVAEATIDRISRPEVQQAYSNPSPRLVKAVRATKRLADEDMPDMLMDLTKFTHRQLLERRMVQQLVADGAELVDVHPENLVAREGALRDVAGAAGDEAFPMRNLPAGTAAVGRRAGVRPTREQVEELLSKEERSLVRGKYKGARGVLKRWLGELYDAERYGGPPSKQQVREEVGLQQSARAREKRRGNLSRETAGRVEVLAAIDKHGPWSRQVARLVDDAGGNRDELWRMVREARMEKVGSVDRFPKNMIEQKLLENGYHPTDRMANLPGDDGMVDVIVEWMDEATGGHGVTVIAEGGRHLGEGFDPGQSAGWMDDTDAAAWVAEARRLDPDLPRNIDDRDVAYAVSGRWQPLDAPHSMPSKKEFVDRAHDAIVRVLVDLPDHVDAAGELGNIRGPAARALADRLGLRDPEMGLEPDGAAWAKALAEVARSAGFDERFREQARSVRIARERLDQEGVDAFDKAFDKAPLPEPQFLDPQTGMLVSELDDDVIAARVGDASYAPHKPEHRRGSGSGVTRSNVTVAGAPAGPQLKRNIGRRFATGNLDMSPMRLLQEADNLLRAKHSDEIYNAAIARGIPFDEAAFLEGGGADKWVVLDERGIKKLAERLDAMTGYVRQVGEVLGEQRATELVQRLRELQSESTRVADEAVKTGDTKALVMVPRGYFDKLAGDMRESSDFAKAVFDRPLDVFRASVLFLTGRYYVNNIIGQNFLLRVKDTGPRFVQEYASFLVNAGRLKEARELIGAGATNEQLSKLGVHALIEKHAPELRGASQYDVEVGSGVQDVITRLGMSDSTVKRGVAAMLRFPDTANRFGAYLSDDLTRMFRFGRLMQPHIDAARADGWSGNDTQIGLRLLDQDEQLRTNVIEETLGDLIDYRSMGHLERVYVRRFIPFYGWLRGISTWAADLGYNHPAKMWALMEASKIGQDENAEWNKKVPRWLTGAARIGDEQDGMQTVVTTQGLVPLSTIGDLAGIARGAFLERPDRSLAGAQVLGQINPYARSALAAINRGRDVGSGMPMLMPGQSMNRSSADGRVPGAPGMLTTALLGWVGTTPQAQLVSQYRTQQDNQRDYGAPSSPSAVYRSPYWHYLASYMGLPIRNVNVSGAQTRRASDDAVLAGEGRVFG